MPGTYLHIAIKSNNNKLAKLLIENGVSVKSTNRTEETPLHVAIKYNNFKITKILLDNNSDPNTKNINGQTPLHYACLMSDCELIELLLFSGANMDILDNKKVSPIDIVISNFRKNPLNLQNREIIQMIKVQTNVSLPTFGSHHFPDILAQTK
jgi:ankyrin repeat protein